MKNELQITKKGEEATPYLVPMLFDNDTANIDGVTILYNARYKYVVEIDNISSSLVQHNSCSFEPACSLNVKEEVLEPKELKINISTRKEDYQENYSELISLDQYNNDVINSVKNVISKVLWNGNSVFNNKLKGLKYHLDQRATKVEIDVKKFTKDNVVDVMEKCLDEYEKLNHGLIGEYRILLPYKVMSLLAKNDYPLINIIPIDGLYNEIFVGDVKNIVIATDLKSDFNQVSVMDMSKITGYDIGLEGKEPEQELRFVAKFKLDVNVIDANKIIWCRLNN